MSEAGAVHRRLRQVAHRGGDGEAGDGPGRQSARHDREHKAQAEREQDTLGVKGDAQGEAELRERRAHDRHDRHAESQPCEHTEPCRGHVIDRTFEEQQPYGVRAPHADGPRHTQLGAALRSREHEDQEDQQHANGQREEREEREDASKYALRLKRELHAFELDLLRV
jgi:hypothetical protein